MIQRRAHVYCEAQVKCLFIQVLQPSIYHSIPAYRSPAGRIPCHSSNYPARKLSLRISRRYSLNWRCQLLETASFQSRKSWKESLGASHTVQWSCLEQILGIFFSNRHCPDTNYGISYNIHRNTHQNSSNPRCKPPIAPPSSVNMICTAIYESDIRGLRVQGEEKIRCSK